MKPSDKLRHGFERAVSSAEAMLGNQSGLEAFGSAVDAIINAYRSGGRLYVVGNGGSAADAQHLAAELVCKLGRSRPSIAAEALTVDTSVLTAIGNDYGYDEVFARQIQGKATPKDMMLALTTSGQSRNVLRALEECRRLGVKTVVFAGRDGGPARDLADFCVIAPGETTSEIQQIHQVLYHTLCACVEEAICPPGV